MESLEYELQVEEKGPSPWRFATAVDVACLVILLVHGLYLITQALGLLTLAPKIPLSTLLSVRAIPNLLPLVAQVGLVGLAIARLTGAKMRGVPALVLVALFVGPSILQFVGRLGALVGNWAFFPYVVFDFITMLTTNAIIAVGVMGKPMDEKWRVLRLKWCMCVLMVPWIVAWTGTAIVQFTVIRLISLDGLPAGVYVQPVLCMVVVCVAACMVSAAVVRGKDNLPGGWRIATWIALMVFVVGTCVLLVGGRWVSIRQREAIWYLSRGVNALGIATVAVVVARPWLVRGEQTNVERLKDEVA